jgi:hypothetical protein
MYNYIISFIYVCNQKKIYTHLPLNPLIYFQAEAFFCFM